MIDAAKKVNEVKKEWGNISLAADCGGEGDLSKLIALDEEMNDWFGRLEDALEELDKAIARARDDTELYKIGGKQA